jgi:TonB family protein
MPAPGPAAKASKPLEEEVSKATAEKPESKPAEEKETEEPRQQPPAEQSPPAAVRTEYTMEEYNEYVRAANERDPATRRRLLEEFLAKNPRSALVPNAQRLLKETAPPQRLRFAGNDARLKIVHHVQPIYPPLARKAGIGGTVRLQAVIGTDGLVKETAVLEGHPLLVQAALDAVRQWLYQVPGGGIGGGVFVAGRDGVTTPNCISCPLPSYTEQALRAKYQGFVTLRTVLITEGGATGIPFAKRAGFGLNQAATDAVSQRRFEPARGPEGLPVAAGTMIEVMFKAHEFGLCGLKFHSSFPSNRRRAKPFRAIRLALLREGGRE